MKRLLLFGELQLSLVEFKFVLLFKEVLALIVQVVKQVRVHLFLVRAEEHFVGVLKRGINEGKTVNVVEDSVLDEEDL